MKTTYLICFLFFLTTALWAQSPGCKVMAVSEKGETELNPELGTLTPNGVTYSVFMFRASDLANISTLKFIFPLKDLSAAQVTETFPISSPYFISTGNTPTDLIIIPSYYIEKGSIEKGHYPDFIFKCKDLLAQEFTLDDIAKAEKALEKWINKKKNEIQRTN